MTFELAMNHTQNVPVETKIAFSFYDLGLAYEKRNRYELAIENYQKSLDYDEDLHFVKTNLENLKKKLSLHNFLRDSMAKYKVPNSQLGLIPILNN